MRPFNYTQTASRILETRGVIRQLCEIHSCNGELNMLSVTQKRILSGPEKSVKYQDMASFCRVSGSGVTETRQKALVHNRVELKESLDMPVLAYWNIRNALPDFNGDTTPPRLNADHLKSVDLLSATAKASVGDSDQAVSDSVSNLVSIFSFYCGIRNPERNNIEMIEEMIAGFNKAVVDQSVVPLLAIICFVMDYNYVQTRLRGLRQDDHLLLNFLLTRYGFVVGMYASLETAFEEKSEEGGAAFEESAKGWESGRSNYIPYVTFVLRTVLDVYRDLLGKLKPAIKDRTSRTDRILEVIRGNEDGVSKREIVKALPDIGLKTIERRLNELMENGTILKFVSKRDVCFKNVKVRLSQASLDKIRDRINLDSISYQSDQKEKIYNTMPGLEKHPNQKEDQSDSGKKSKAE